MIKASDCERQGCQNYTVNQLIYSPAVDESSVWNTVLPVGCSAFGCRSRRRRGEAGVRSSVASTVSSTCAPTSALFSGHSSRSGSGPQPGCLQPGAVHLLLCVGYRPGESLELKRV